MSFRDRYNRFNGNNGNIQSYMTTDDFVTDDETNEANEVDEVIETQEPTEPTEPKEPITPTAPKASTFSNISNASNSSNSSNVSTVQVNAPKTPTSGIDPMEYLGHAYKPTKKERYVNVSFTIPAEELRRLIYTFRMVKNVGNLFDAIVAENPEPVNLFDVGDMNEVQDQIDALVERAGVDISGESDKS